MFNPQAYENSGPAGVAVLEVSPGPQAGHAGSAPEQSPQFVPLCRTLVHGDVTGPLASLTVEHTYRFHSAETDGPIEALYRFPLPGDAAVIGVRVSFGEVAIEASLKARPQAEAEYEEARSEGRQATLLTRESPDVFTLHVAGIQPGEDVVVETRYVHLARREGAGWSLRLPLTTAPRYMRSDELAGRHAHGQPLALLRDPGHRFSLDLRFPGLEDAGAVRCGTHELAVESTGESVRVRLREDEVVPDRDCVITWHPRSEPDRTALSAWVHEDAADGHLYFLAAASPPRAGAAEGQRAVAREVILLVDHSGSMQGPKWQAADWAVLQFLSGLRSRDLFNVGLFHSSLRWMDRVPQLATPENVRAGGDFVRGHRDNGGTELGGALEQALRQRRSGRSRREPEPEGSHLVRHVLIVTDGQVTDDGRLIRLVEREAERPDRRRVSVICIDAAPNSYLVHELVDAGGGSARFLTSDPAQEDVTTALDGVLAEWGAPIAVDVRLHTNRASVELAGSARATGSADLGHLVVGRTLWIAGRVSLAGGGDERRPPLRLELRSGDASIAAWEEPADQDSAVAGPAIKALFGARRVAGLEFLMHSYRQGDELRAALERLGYDAAAVLGESQGNQAEAPVYAETALNESREALRALLVQEALRYGLASAETAFVARRTERGEPAKETVVVGNALAAGWSDRFLFRSAAGASAGSYAASAAGSAGAGFFRRAFPVREFRAAVPEMGSRTMGSRDESQALRVRARLPRLQDVTAMGETLSQLVGDLLAPQGKSANPISSGSGDEAHPARSPSTVLFSGQPPAGQAERVLYDSRAAGAATLPDTTRLTGLVVEVSAPLEEIDPALTLLLYVGDMASPRARVRVVDVLRQDGRRPLNVVLGAGAPVVLALEGPPGPSGKGSLTLRVALEHA